MQQQKKIPNGQRGADSEGPTARGRQQRAGPVWPISYQLRSACGRSPRSIRRGSPRQVGRLAYAAVACANIQVSIALFLFFITLQHSRRTPINQRISYNEDSSKKGSNLYI